jgi:hypothetical protein
MIKNVSATVVWFSAAAWAISSRMALLSRTMTQQSRRQFPCFVTFIPQS